MWLFTSRGFLSVVNPTHRDPVLRGFANDRAAYDRAMSGCLLVRARRKGHIEAHFPHAAVIRVDARDYRYRALIDRNTVALFIADYVKGIRYTNFKDTIKDHDYHDAAGECWGVLHRLQSREREAPYPTPPKYKPGKGFEFDGVNDGIDLDFGGLRGHGDEFPLEEGPNARPHPLVEAGRSPIVGKARIKPSKKGGQ